MPTLLSGTGETSIQNVDNNVRDMDTPVYELEPSAVPLTVLLNAMGSKAARQPKVEWLEDEPMPRITTLSASAAASATAFGVANDYFRVGDELKFNSLGFGLLVTATAVGSVSGTILGTTVSGVSGSEVFLIGNANAEFATLREIKFTDLVVPYNYCQIVRTPFGVSETEEATEHYGGDERDRLSKHFGIEHARTLDDLFFSGVRSITSSTRTMGGVTSYVSTNLIADTGGLTVGDWETALRRVFRYGSGSRLALCSPIGMSAIESYARNNIRVVNDDGARYGINMKTYQSGQGTVTLVMNRKWADSSVLGGYIALLDMDNAGVQERPLRKTRLKKNVQTPSADGFQDEYITETCIQVKHERKHGIVTGITAPTG